jgi:hypothetical protein
MFVPAHPLVFINKCFCQASAENEIEKVESDLCQVFSEKNRGDVLALAPCDLVFLVETECWFKTKYA